MGDPLRREPHSGAAGGLVTWRLLTSSSRTRPRRRHATTLTAIYLAVGLLAATGGARPTGLGWLDAVLLGLGGAAAAACGVRARTVPVYVAAGAAALCQPEVAPLALGCLALLAALSRRLLPRRTVAGALAGGLTWAAAVGAPLEPAARPVVVPMLALGWVVLSARQHGSQRFRRRLERAAAGSALLVLVGGGLGALAVVNARAHVERGADLVDSGLDAAREGDTSRALDQLRGARNALAAGESSLGAAWARPAWLVPGVSQNARALHQIVAEVGDLAGAGIRTVEEADVDALRASRGQVDLATVTAIEAPLTEIVAELEAADARLADLTDWWLLPPMADRLDEARDELADAIPSARLALDGVRSAPHLLGADGPRTYLVLFTTPVEARATTGFPGNFAEVTFSDGRFDMTRFGRISELSDALPNGTAIELPPEYAARYARFDPASEWRSLPFSPDFPTVATLAAELHRRSGGPPVDGVMSIDPVALAAFLRFTGPVAVAGVDEPLGARNAADFLLRGQYVDLPDNPERIDVLEQLAEVTFDRLSTVDLPGPSELGDILGPTVSEGHLQIVSFDDDAARFLDGLGASGRLPEVQGDFVAVTTSNIAMNKVDLFLRRSLDYDVHWDPSTGAVRATATITLTNEAPASGLPDYILDNNVGALRPGGVDMPKGWNYTFLTLYTPFDAAGATIDGQPLGLEVLPELGRNAVSAFVEIAPGARRTLVIELEGVLPGDEYVLDLATQPLVEAESARVRVNVAGGGTVTTSGPMTAARGVATGSWPLVRDVQIGVSND